MVPSSSHRASATPSGIDWHDIFASSPNPCLVLSLDLITVDANAAYLSLLNLTREKLLGRYLFDVFPPRDHEIQDEVHASLMHVVEERTSHAITLLHYPVVTDSGIHDRYWSVHNAPLIDAKGNVIGILSCPRDVTHLLTPSVEVDSYADTPKSMSGTADARQINLRLARERDRFRHLMRQAPGFITITRGPTHVFEMVNDAYYQLVGHRPVVGKPVRRALPELAGQGFYELLDGVYATGKPFIGRSMPIQVQVTPNSPLVQRYVDFIYQPILDKEGSVSGIFVQGHDVTEVHKLTEIVSHQATHDSLTGLFNRSEFENRLAQAVEESTAGGGPHSLIYLDLDQFKVVNDSSGHAAGDELLRQVSMRLRATLTPSDTVARLGGDEFGILLNKKDHVAALVVAEQLRSTIDNLEFSWGRQVFGCSASLGVITLGEDTGESADALSAADSACFLAKEQGRNRIHVHHMTDNEVVTRQREIDWVSRLRVALAENRLILYAQKIAPTCNAVSDSRKMRIELLLRLRDTDHTLVPPMAFIPAAERFGLMPTIDQYVVCRAFARLAALPRRLRETVNISINLSGNTLSDDRFLSFIKERLPADPLFSRCVCFEVTETAALQNLSRTAEMMVQLKALGFSFALDDFGSGMSSMGYLKQLPVDYLKIDGSFIRQITTNPVDAVIVEAMVKVAAAMKINTVAEYVDNETTRSMLERLRIDYVQGFAIHIPEPFENVMNELA